MKTLEFFKKETTIFTIILFGGILLVSVIIFFVWNELPFYKDGVINAEKFGQFGDFIGGVVGSFWSLAGIFLFYLALTEQRNDFKTNQEALNLQVKALNQQITEFQLQREELESSRKIYEEQSKTLRTQQFESNFYSLLEVHSSIKKGLPSTHENDFFKTIYNSLYIGFNHEVVYQEHHKALVEGYVELFNKHSGFLSHYFKSFYRIVKIVDSHPSLSDDEKQFYLKILRAQLTDYEQLLLYYNSHTIYGEKARPLILKYNLLKHVPSFKKPEYEYYQSIQKDSMIVLFVSWLTRFLMKNIPYFYNIEFEESKIEEECPYFDCIVAILFQEHISLNIYCNINIAENGISLTDAEFQNFVYVFLLEKLQFSKYLDENSVKVEKQITHTENKKIFGFEIKSTIRLDI